MWAANQLADLLAKEGAGLAAHSPSVISDLLSQAKLVKQVAIYVGQLTLEANQHKRPDGICRADAQKLDACVARKKALEKQLRKEAGPPRQGGGPKRTAGKANKATRAVGNVAMASVERGAIARSTVGRRRKLADLRSSREASRQFEAFVAGHETRVENAKPRAASAPCGSRPSAAERLRLLRERVVAKQADGQGRCSVKPSAKCVPTSDCGVPAIVSCSLPNGGPAE